VEFKKGIWDFLENKCIIKKGRIGRRNLLKLRENVGIDNNQMDRDAFSSQAPARAQVIWALYGQNFSK